MIQELRRAYPDWEVLDEDEEERVDNLKTKRQRGKGAPKKRRSAAGTFFRLWYCCVGVLMFVTF